jgi:hypothetical protein
MASAAKDTYIRAFAITLLRDDASDEADDIQSLEVPESAADMAVFTVYASLYTEVAVVIRRRPAEMNDVSFSELGFG